MPERIETLRVRAPLAEAAQLCERGMDADHWTRHAGPEGDVNWGAQLAPARAPEVPNADWVTWCDEQMRFRGLLRVANQVIATIALRSCGDDETEVVVAGACYGLGPIQQRHVDGRVISLVAAIRGAA